MRTGGSRWSQRLVEAGQRLASPLRLGDPANWTPRAYDHAYGCGARDVAMADNHIEERLRGRLPFVFAERREHGRAAVWDPRGLNPKRTRRVRRTAASARDRIGPWSRVGGPTPENDLRADGRRLPGAAFPFPLASACP